jgi:hypothetical protein
MSNTATFTLSIKGGPNLSACAKWRWLYANAQGFLGELQQMDDPEIASLLEPQSSLPGATRLAMLTQLAERRSRP